MSKLRVWILTCVALLVAACATTHKQPQGPDLSGNWLLTTESQMGAQEAQMTVRQTGKALVGTITISGQAGTVDYLGSVKGSAVAFDFTMDVQGTELKLHYSGTVDGDTMKGKAVFGQFGEGRFTAHRE